MAKRTTKRQTDYNLGERIKYLRDLRKLTQNDLAKLSKLSQATIAHIEKGNKDPSVKTLKQVSDALDVHIGTLFSTNEVFVFDLKRLRRKYDKSSKLTPHLYMGLGMVIQFARDIGYIK